MAQLFASGPVLATPGAVRLGVDLREYVHRHMAGHFGTAGSRYEPDIAELNLHAVRCGGRVLSTYETPAGELCVMTDGLAPGGVAGENTYTTALLPEEYWHE